jgi:hypothetical protein
MAKRTASARDKEKSKSPSRSSRQAKVVSIKKDTKKPARQKATKSTMAATPEPVVDDPSVNGNMQARIAERAYELHHQRGGHHGQDLDDWLTAEREVLSEEVC